MGIIITLSIVIPAKNEEKNIVNLLDCLDKQTFKNFDIIIADANSIDFTILNALSHKLSYKIKKLERELNDCKLK